MIQVLVCDWKDDPDEELLKKLYDTGISGNAALLLENCFQRFGVQHLFRPLLQLGRRSFCESRFRPVWQLAETLPQLSAQQQSAALLQALLQTQFLTALHAEPLGAADVTHFRVLLQFLNFIDFQLANS